MEGRSLEEEQERQEVLLIHSQVSRIKREDEEARRHLLMKLQLLETRPAAGGVRGHESSPPASRSLSPLRRAGEAVPVGDWA
jgi:hypothetical protein